MTAVIVDDEKKICLLLRRLIDWAGLGIEIVGECYNGNTAYELICERRPDIVVTDIRMPGLDGLDMIKRLQQAGVTPEFLLISGHKNFEYALNAIHYGVRNYLVKPLDAEDLRDNLLEIRNRILEKRNSADTVQSLYNRLSKSLRVIGEQFVGQFIENPDILDGMDVRAINKTYLTNLRPGQFALAAVQLDIYSRIDENQAHVLVDKVKLYFEKRMREMCVCAVEKTAAPRIILMLNAEDEKAAATRLQDVLADANDWFSDFCVLTVGLSGFLPLPAGEQLAQARTAADSRIDTRSGYIIRYTAIAPEGEPLDEDLLRQMADVLKEGSKDAFGEWFGAHQARLLRRDIPATQFMRDAHRVANEIAETLKRLNGELESSHGFSSVHTAISRGTSRPAITDAIRVWAGQQLEEHRERLLKQGGLNVRRAKAYIQEHFTEDITLQQVADHVHMNASYFSTVFKKNEGVGFAEYVTTLRIEASKKFLENPKLSIAEAGKAAGFSDSTHFSRTFTKAVGIRPKDFRKLL